MRRLVLVMVLGLAASAPCPLALPVGLAAALTDSFGWRKLLLAVALLGPIPTLPLVRSVVRRRCTSANLGLVSLGCLNVIPIARLVPTPAGPLGVVLWLPIILGAVTWRFLIVRPALELESR